MANFVQTVRGTVTSRTAPASAFTAGQISVANTATLILAANTSRVSITIINTGTTAVYLGPTNAVTTATGQKLAGIDGYPIKLRTTSAVYGIAASGSQTVTYLEETV